MEIPIRMSQRMAFRRIAISSYETYPRLSLRMFRMDVDFSGSTTSSEFRVAWSYSHQMTRFLRTIK